MGGKLKDDTAQSTLSLSGAVQPPSRHTLTDTKQPRITHLLGGKASLVLGRDEAQDESKESDVKEESEVASQAVSSQALPTQEYRAPSCSAPPSEVPTQSYDDASSQPNPVVQLFEDSKPCAPVSTVVGESDNAAQVAENDAPRKRKRLQQAADSDDEDAAAGVQKVGIKAEQVDPDDWRERIKVSILAGLCWSFWLKEPCRRMRSELLPTFMPSPAKH